VYDSAAVTRRRQLHLRVRRRLAVRHVVVVQPARRLRLDAGLRYDVTGYAYRTNLPATQAGRWRVPGDTSLTYTRLSPKAGVTYEASPSVALFASWRSGFRAPSQGQLFQQGSAANTVGLAPVTAASWEGGARGQLGRRVLYQLSAYDMTLRDDILTYTRPDGLREARNAGRTRHRGVETSVSAMLVPALKLDASYSVSDQRYTTYAPQAARAAAPAHNGQPARAATPEVSFAGLRIEQAPATLANALLTWSPRLLRGGRVAAEWSHTGRYVAGYRFDARGLPADAVMYGGHQVWSLHANAQLLPHVELFGRVTNLTDRRYAELASFTANDRVQPDALTPGAPRTVHAGLRWGWSK
jgi:outer membrane receptor protein involved in Fe transport